MNSFPVFCLDIGKYAVFAIKAASPNELHDYLGDNTGMTLTAPCVCFANVSDSGPHTTTLLLLL